MQRYKKTQQYRVFVSKNAKKSTKNAPVIHIIQIFSIPLHNQKGVWVQQAIHPADTTTEQNFS